MPDSPVFLRRLPGCDAVWQRFGTWHAACEALLDGWDPAHAGRVGAQRPRLPAYESFRQRWGSWPGAMRAAQITDAELARRARAGGPAQPDVAVLTDRRLRRARRPHAVAPADGPLTLEIVRTARLDRGLSETAQRAAVRMTLSEWRRLLTQPTLPA